MKYHISMFIAILLLIIAAFMLGYNEAETKYANTEIKLKSELEKTMTEYEYVLDRLVLATKQNENAGIIVLERDELNLMYREWQHCADELSRYIVNHHEPYQFKKQEHITYKEN